MFTGIIEEIGQIQSVKTLSGGRQFQIAASRIIEGIKIDDSIAVNGVCLTVTETGRDSFFATAVQETLNRTTLAQAGKGTNLNLERALRAGDRMGGHWVQGHVDGIGHVVGRRSAGTGIILSLELPEKLLPFVVEKGSIAVHGVSLTVAGVKGRRIDMAVIPHTLQKTVLNEVSSGFPVNIETDLIGKYLYRWSRNGTGMNSLKGFGGFIDKL